MNLATIKEEIATYFRTKPEVIAVYLFGSHARGKAHARSDIDIGILLDGNDTAIFPAKREEYLAGLGRILRQEIDPVIMNTAGETLQKQILSKGACLLVRDARKLSWHKMIMLARIAEFTPCLRQIEAGWLRKHLPGGSRG